MSKPKRGLFTEPDLFSTLIFSFESPKLKKYASAGLAPRPPVYGVLLQPLQLANKKPLTEGADHPLTLFPTAPQVLSRVLISPLTCPLTLALYLSPSIGKPNC